MFLTYQYRIKDSSSRQRLSRLAWRVNFVWNYCNDLAIKYFNQYKSTEVFPFISEYELNNYTAGSSKELGVSSTTIQQIAKQYVQSRKQHKKIKLRWRSAKRNLGWIPFSTNAIQIKNDIITYKKQKFKIYKSRLLPEGAEIKTGSFVQDSRNQWYINITFKIDADVKHPHRDQEVGIDLGIKNQITLSAGQQFKRKSLTKKYEKKLARAQRARHKGQVRNIHAKIKNSRKDWTHKVTTQIARQFGKIYIGDLGTAQIVKKNKKISIGHDTLKKESPGSQPRGDVNA